LSPSPALITTSDHIPAPGARSQPVQDELHQAVVVREESRQQQEEASLGVKNPE